MDPQAVPAVLLYSVALVIGAFWLFLPVMIWSKLREVVKLLKEIRDASNATAENTRRPDQAPRASSSVRYG